MWIRSGAIVAALWLGGASALAQPATDAPLSAIDWLSDTVFDPLPPPGGPIAETVETESIDVAPLDSLAVDAVGLLSREVTGLPADFWGPTSTADLVQLLRQQSLDMPVPARDLLFRLILAELDPPIDAGPDHALFVARIDTLLRFGALDEAQALLERAGPKDPALFRRWFDVSLLTGNEDRACAVMRAAPDIAPTFAARVFCLARGNDWAAAALSLDTGRALGLVSEAEDALLARFLDPELFGDAPLDPLPQPLTPLTYRMLLALNEAPTAGTLPLAFAHAALDPVAGWKQRLDAAERLARHGGLPPRRLFALYTERRPAASGGVWERVAAVQDVDAALLGGDADRLWAALPQAASELQAVGLLTPFARVYGDRIAALSPPPALQAVRDRIVLLSGRGETHAASLADPFLAGVAQGRATAPTDADLGRVTVANVFSVSRPGLTATDETLLRQGRLGEATLRALRRLGNARPDPGDLEAGLAVLRRLGFESDARQIALALLLGPEVAR